MFSTRGARGRGRGRSKTWVNPETLSTAGKPAEIPENHLNSQKKMTDLIDQKDELQDRTTRFTSQPQNNNFMTVI